MTEITDSEIDVAQLMSDIRTAVEEREAEGKKSVTGASMKLENLLSNPVEFQEQSIELMPLRLQPDFIPSRDDHYHINDLLKYHDHIFIWNAYRAILKREPDDVGLQEFLGKLRSGRFNKIDVLAALRFSPEGRQRNVRIDGLARPASIRKLYRVPVLGYLLEMVVGVARLPSMIRSQRQFETYAAAQAERLATHLNQVSHKSFQTAESLSRKLEQAAESFSRELATISEEHRKLAELHEHQWTQVSEEQRRFAEEQMKLAETQHQQNVGLWREQREIILHLSRLRDELNARLVQSYKISGAERPASEKVSIKESKLDALLASFAENFRGSREEIKEGLKFYLPLLKSAGISRDILDVGCGRGEWLEILREEGMEARGVEINRALAAETRSLGLEVIEGDALRYLRGLPDESLNAVTGFHFIEHIAFETLIELMDEIKRKLKRGGLVIFETPNPKNLVVGACNFYSDPTHLKPLFPETIQFIMSNRGFQGVRIEYLNPVGGSPFKDESESSQALDSWFYSPRDFAVIGHKMQN